MSSVKVKNLCVKLLDSASLSIMPFVICGRNRRRVSSGMCWRHHRSKAIRNCFVSSLVKRVLLGCFCVKGRSSWLDEALLVMASQLIVKLWQRLFWVVIYAAGSGKYHWNACDYASLLPYGVSTWLSACHAESESWHLYLIHRVMTSTPDLIHTTI